MKKLNVILFCFLFLSLTAGCTAEPAGPLLKVSDRTHKSLADAVFETIDSQIYLIGEHHDNPQHHSNQLEIIRELHEVAEKPISIALEMFDTRYQPQLDQWVDGSLSLHEFIRIYHENWDQPWALYRDIFLYAREHQIGLVALNIPRNVVRKVARNGFASLTPDDLAELPRGITCDVTPQYETFIKRVFGWHGRKNKSFTNFCEAQVLWDTVMALNILDYFKKGMVAKLVVLAGDGHAWKPGIPRQISLRENLSVTVFIPETAKLNRKNVSEGDTDYLWLLNII